MNEIKALAILFTKRNKAANPLEISEAAKELWQIYGSYKEASKQVPISEATLRKWGMLHNAPPGVKAYVREGKLYPTIAFRIMAVFCYEDQTEVAQAVLGWGLPETERLIKYKLQHPFWTIDQCKTEVINGAIVELILRG